MLDTRNGSTVLGLICFQFSITRGGELAIRLPTTYKVTQASARLILTTSPIISVHIMSEMNTSTALCHPPDTA